MKQVIIISAFLFSQIAFAVPAGTKGEDGNFKVSEKSLNHLGVKFVSLNGPGPWKVPAAALVKIKLTQGVYRRFEGEITYVIVRTSEADKGNLYISSEDLEEGDEVAVQGTNYLRMAETDLNSETVDTCAH
jgi:hypothetical protein